MALPSPVAWLSEAAQRRALAASAALALALLLALDAIGRPLHTDSAPAGIVSFELAGSVARAEEILESWSPEARQRAALGLGLDYLFLVVYSAAIALGCARVASHWSARAPRLADLGIALAWAQPVAAGLDALENYGLVRLLLGDAREGWARLAAVCAVPKFAIVALGLAYVAGAAVALVLRRR